MSSIAARRANKRAYPLQPNGILSRGTHGILAQMGYQGGQWLRTSRSRSGKTSDDGTLLGSWLLLWLVVY